MTKQFQAAAALAEEARYLRLWGAVRQGAQYGRQFGPQAALRWALAMASEGAEGECLARIAAADACR